MVFQLTLSTLFIFVLLQMKTGVWMTWITDHVFHFSYRCVVNIWEIYSWRIQKKKHYHEEDNFFLRNFPSKSHIRGSEMEHIHYKSYCAENDKTIFFRFHLNNWNYAAIFEHECNNKYSIRYAMWHIIICAYAYTEIYCLQ